MSELWTFEVIRLPGSEYPGRVLEQGPIPSGQATMEEARAILQDRCNGPSYRIKPALKLRPEAVRFLNEEGAEMLIYSVIDLRRDGGTISPKDD